MEVVEMLKPHDESEEEAMLRQALELSRLQALEDQRHRNEIDEEYYLQMKYLLENPEFDAQLDAANGEICGATAVESDKCFDNVGSVEGEEIVVFKTTTLSAYHCRKRLAESYESDRPMKRRTDNCKMNFRKVRVNSRELRRNSRELRMLQLDTMEDFYKISDNHECQGAKPKHKRCNFREEYSQGNNIVESNVKKESFDFTKMYDAGIWADVYQPQFGSKNQSVSAHSANHNDDWNEGSQDNIKGEEVDEFESVSNNKGCAIVAAPSGKESQKGSTKILDMCCQEEGHHRNANKQEQLLGKTPEWPKFMSNNTVSAQDKHAAEKKECLCGEELSTCSDSVPQACMAIECSNVCVTNEAEERKSVLEKEKTFFSKPDCSMYENAFEQSRKKNALNTCQFYWNTQHVPLHCSESDSSLKLDRKYTTKINSSKILEHDTWDEDLEHMLKSVKDFHLSTDTPDS